MSAVNRLSVLAFATTALAVPHMVFGHGHAHQHLHREAPYPYPMANGTSVMGTAAAAGSSSSSAAAAETAFDHTTMTSTAYQTVTVNQASQASAVSAAAYQGASQAAAQGTSQGGEQCAAVTVTTTEKVYMTVTAGQAPSSSAEVSAAEGSSAAPSTQQAPVYSASSSVAAPASSSSSSEESPAMTSEASAPAYSAPASTSSAEAAPVSTSAVPKENAPASSSSPAIAVSMSVSSLGDKGAEGGAATATSAAPSSYSSSTSSSGKRGLAYNDASLVDCFSGSNQVSWAYNWGSSSNGLSGFNFIPTLWGTASTYSDSWSENAKSAISSGSTHLFSFNEPDISSQANMSPQEAATAWTTYMEPFANQAKLCAPAVTNGPASQNMGLTWLKEFMSACSDCTIDCLNIHWYDSATNTEYFKQHVSDAISMADGKPVYVSEMGATGSDDQINSFLQEVMPWMDSNSGVAGYAYYMVSDGLLVTGTEPSTYGSTYKTYSS